MKISDARKVVKRRILLGIAVMTCAILFLFGSALKSVYVAVGTVPEPFSAISYGFRVLIHSIYENTQFASWFWQHAPVIQPEKINTIDNLEFIFIMIMGGIGRLILDSASKLSKRIAKVILKVEENIWEKELMNQQGHIETGHPDVLEINIELNSEEQWYGRPVGILLLGLAVTVLGQLLNLQFGFVKL